ncbi:hypothetical protein PTTG_07737 [Puccinia triticina 1-1 BBBD Race 1]|uniref:Uncharacterized protein n=1 Tax=Puccinia triticina (isolate 1-1 / race 1 (BBBD)) TaxID=630390 RepID=A0A180GMG0_PUCT1|nr:hypothetical protein PTTG_07737 [Puccinia triticina 1-1 BBBD Race 1]
MSSHEYFDPYDKIWKIADLSAFIYRLNPHEVIASNAKIEQYREIAMRLILERNGAQLSDTRVTRQTRKNTADNNLRAGAPQQNPPLAIQKPRPGPKAKPVSRAPPPAVLKASNTCAPPATSTTRPLTLTSNGSAQAFKTSKNTTRPTTPTVTKPVLKRRPPSPAQPVLKKLKATRSNAEPVGPKIVPQPSLRSHTPAIAKAVSQPIVTKPRAQVPPETVQRKRVASVHFAETDRKRTRQPPPSDLASESQSSDSQGSDDHTDSRSGDSNTQDDEEDEEDKDVEEDDEDEEVEEIDEIQESNTRPEESGSSYEASNHSYASSQAGDDEPIVIKRLNSSVDVLHNHSSSSQHQPDSSLLQQSQMKARQMNIAVQSANSAVRELRQTHKTACESNSTTPSANTSTQGLRQTHKKTRESNATTQPVSPSIHQNHKKARNSNAATRSQQKDRSNVSQDQHTISRVATSHSGLTAGRLHEYMPGYGQFSNSLLITK